MANSYFGKYRSTNDKCLIGGVKKGQTSRFGNRAEAELRLSQVIEWNGAHCEGEIHESTQPPEIFTHCGYLSQAVGCICFRCGTTLTVEHAKVSCGNFEIGEDVLIEPRLESAKVTHIFPEEEEVIVEIAGQSIRLKVNQVHPVEDDNWGDYGVYEDEVFDNDNQPI